MFIKPAYTLFLRTGEVCNAGCRTCPVGRKGDEDKPPTVKFMKPEMLDRILNRIEEQARIINLAYHYYGEPMLNSYMPELVHIGQVEHGIDGVLSTNLSVQPDRIRAVMRCGIRKLMISVSGFTNETHQISHKGIDIERVKEHMHIVAEERLPRTYVQVSWHQYRYNRHEEPLMKELCERLGFAWTPYETGVLPLERVAERWRDGKIDDAERDIYTKLPEAKRLCFDRRDWACIHQDRMITIDADGQLSACCVKNHKDNMGYGALRPASVFDTDLEEYNRWRKQDDVRCKACRATGLHVYAMQAYRVPNTRKVRAFKAFENAWRRANLGGVFPKVSAWWSNLNYARPHTQARQSFLTGKAKQ